MASSLKALSGQLTAGLGHPSVEIMSELGHALDNEQFVFKKPCVQCKTN